jgi:hypothetical protein
VRPFVVAVDPHCLHRCITSSSADGGCHDRSIVGYIAETNK